MSPVTPRLTSPYVTLELYKPSIKIIIIMLILIKYFFDYKKKTRLSITFAFCPRDKTYANQFADYLVSSNEL